MWASVCHCLCAATGDHADRDSIAVTPAGGDHTKNTHPQLENSVVEEFVYIFHCQKMYIMYIF